MRKLYIIPNASHIEKSIELAERYGAGFEYNDFFIPEILDDEKIQSDIINKYNKGQLDVLVFYIIA